MFHQLGSVIDKLGLRKPIDRRSTEDPQKIHRRSTEIHRRSTEDPQKIDRKIPLRFLCIYNYFYSF
jgi:hypothetical protein